MIKLIIFDLDGVLVDAREIHYQALNDALRSIGEKYVIDREEHLSTFDGLPTKKKLGLLTEERGLPEALHDIVWKKKQEATIDIIKLMPHNERLIEVLYFLRKSGYRLCVASNSIRETTKMMLLENGFMEFIEFFYSNEDVRNPKPNPEMYMHCMIKAGVSPKETLIIEDSHIGRKAATESGAYLLGVMESSDVTLEKIEMMLNRINKDEPINPKWQGGNMNVLIPMAGAGSRFEKAGYTFPKPLIEVHGKPMIQLVTENLNIDARHIFIALEEHKDKYNLPYLLNMIAPENEVIYADGRIRYGAAWDCLRAKEFIDNDEPLLLANSDQFVDWNSNEFMYAMMADGVDGGILTFTATHPKWSFARLDENGFICEVAEKKPISNIATVGIYFWRRGSDFVKYAEQMIEKEIKTNGEFYVCPVFNEAISDGLKIKPYHIDKMWGLGTPEDLEVFLNETNRA